MRRWVDFTAKCFIDLFGDTLAKADLMAYDEAELPADRFLLERLRPVTRRWLQPVTRACFGCECSNFRRGFVRLRDVSRGSYRYDFFHPYRLRCRTPGCSESFMGPPTHAYRVRSGDA